ncbi:hypothetical protein LOTGIDRAFT_66497, partial [Lottia gigantea]
IFSKDATVLISVSNMKVMTASKVIAAVQGALGEDSILSCVPKNGDVYEVSLIDIESARAIVDKELKIDNQPIFVRHLSSKVKVVSFMHLSGLITDEQIESKLKLWRVELLGPIKRRRYENTDVFDGTRFMRVRFPPDVSSLPYSVGFQIESGVEYYSVRHDHQEKVCFSCLSPGHLNSACPDRICRSCNKRGHIQRNCPDTIKEDC